ncbi:MAG: gamma carbonic anhydrase family protein [Rubritepida sp.]|jgi:carbonic anhydrase/acetyltransferase-like protein (isoleucine patch superfamily)|nr:gamma carbonic anhydrase family protein [Rubritepida sp.]
MPIYALNDAEPRLPKSGSYWVAPDAHVVGHVELDEDVGIWFGAVIRGDNELIRIGARTNIQDGAVLHSDRGAPLTIGADVTVGHRAILHGCTVADGSLIGMGATLLNHARIGRHCIVGANALVTEGKEFPDFSLIVGSPAKVMRTLAPETATMLLGSAQGYVANASRFRAGLRRID